MSPKRILLAACMAVVPLTIFGWISPVSGKDRVLTIMSRNMDDGTDFGPIFTATTPTELLTAVAAAYAEVQASNIPERTEAVAAEIAAAQPDLIALQEVSLWRVGPFLNPPATTVTYDTLQLLLDKLAQRGLQYTPIAILTNTDAEAPSAFGLDIRFTDRDVMLACTDLQNSRFKLENVQSQHFITNLVFTNPVLGSLTFPRGWISVDVKMRGKQYRFVTTHLEAFSPLVRAAQASELAQGPGNIDTSIVVAGDFNSDAESSDPVEKAAYNILLGAGLIDDWRESHPSDLGFTWPLHGEDPFTPFAVPFQRIDLVFSRGEKINLVVVRQIGNTTADLTPSGLWPSDHAGLVASFELEP